MPGTPMGRLLAGNARRMRSGGAMSRLRNAIQARASATGRGR
jgi:hypothetical protein